MRLSSLCLAALLIFSSAAFSQHSSGGGGGSSSGGGGGSHGGSSGGSSGGGSHSSASGSSGSSSGHSSGGSISHNATSSRSAAGRNLNSASRSKSLPGPSERNPRMPGKSGLADRLTPKRSLFSFLRHPFRKPEPKPRLVVDLRHRICFNGRCPVCPPGATGGRGGCIGISVPAHRHNFCSQREIWSGGTCLAGTNFLDNCSGLRLAMEHQAQRMQAAQASQQQACADSTQVAPTQECSALSRTAQSEASLYRSWQERYNRCQQGSRTAYPFRVSGIQTLRYSRGELIEPMAMEWSYP